MEEHELRDKRHRAGGQPNGQAQERNDHVLHGENGVRIFRLMVVRDWTERLSVHEPAVDDAGLHERGDDAVDDVHERHVATHQVDDVERPRAFVDDVQRHLVVGHVRHGDLLYQIVLPADRRRRLQQKTVGDKGRIRRNREPGGRAFTAAGPGSANDKFRPAPLSSCHCHGRFVSTEKRTGFLKETIQRISLTIDLFVGHLSVLRYVATRFAERPLSVSPCRKRTHFVRVEKVSIPRVTPKPREFQIKFSKYSYVFLNLKFKLKKYSKP